MKKLKRRSKASGRTSSAEDKRARQPASRAAAGSGKGAGSPKRTAKKKASSGRPAARGETIRRARSRTQGHAPKTGRGMFYIFISTLLAVITGFFSLTIFFDLRHIDCVGTSQYTRNKVISLSGFEWGENLVFLNRGRAEENIISSLSYIKDAKVELKLPDRAIIRLTEREPYGAIKKGTGYFVFDEEGVVFERENIEPPMGLVVIQGIEIENLEIGTNVFSENSEHMSPAIQVLEELYAQNIIDRVKIIDGSESFNVKFSYMGRFTVEMGITEDLPAKLRMLDEIVRQLEDHQRGIIDLGSKRARYADDALGGRL